MSRIVVALGGNALGNSPYEQMELVKATAKSIVDLISQGNEVIVTHGNGPQVGMINLVFNDEMPFPECGAMSQGYIGYHLQNAIYHELKKHKLTKSVATVITQVIVDKNDQAFNNPTKPIGAFYSKEEADKISLEKGYLFKEDAGRGYRRVVPSPLPVDVVEKDIIKSLIDASHIVITVGGGGIPVIKEKDKLEGVAAVIDKDFASSKIAEIIDADFLFILTAVDQVAINFNQPNQKTLDVLTVSDAKKYIAEGQFAKGSMLPKIEAAISFAASKSGRTAIIASLEKANLALEGKSGTKIIL
jgi:carbamate kinase